jgi:hypothetical protein
VLRELSAGCRDGVGHLRLDEFPLGREGVLPVARKQVGEAVAERKRIVETVGDELLRLGPVEAGVPE